jgi:type II secretory pathway component PulF
VPGNISLAELAALNDEIAALVRSGVPLELGLSGFGRSLPGRLGKLTAGLGESLSRGQSLPQTLAEAPADFPPVYRAVVTAGIRAGRLPAALEAMATCVSNLQQIRRSIGMALLYPLLLLITGYLALWFSLVAILPATLEVYEDGAPPFWTAVAALGQWANLSVTIPGTQVAVVVGWIPPLLLGVVAILIWFSTRGPGVLGGGRSVRLAARLPLSGSIVRNGRAAVFAEILGLLVEQEVPLDEALVLAAEVTGDRQMTRTAHEVAAKIAQGGTPPTADQLVGFPPLVAWLTSSGGRQETFVRLARHVADTYRRQVAQQSLWLREQLPLWLVIFIGGSLVVLLALATFLPFTDLMQALGQTHSESMRIRP